MTYSPLFVSAVVPSLLLIWYFHSRDLYPEPQKVVWATFGLGILTVIPVLLVGYPLLKVVGEISDPYARGAGEAFLTAALPEELFKYLVVVFFCSRHKEFDEPMDGIVYGAVASLGFATLENILYVAQGGMANAVMRAVTAVPAHGFMGAIMGYFVGQAKFNPERRASLLVKAYFVPFLLHGFYDFPLLTLKDVIAADPFHEAPVGLEVGLALSTLAVLVFAGVWAIRLTRRLRRDQLTLANERMARGIPPQGYPPPPYPPPPYPQQPYPPPPYPQQPYAAAPPYPPPPGYPPQMHALPPHAMPYYGPPPGPYGYPPPYPMPPGAPVYYPAPPPANAAGVVMLVVGAILACVGGLFSLGFIVALSSGDLRDKDVGPILIAAIVIGVLPLIGGLVLFGKGLQKMRQKPPPLAPPPPFAPPPAA